MRGLIEAIAKECRWQAQLRSGEYASLDDGARDVGLPPRSRQTKTGCDGSRVGRMLRLTHLLPSIIEAILRGHEPAGLSLEKLRTNLPVRWDKEEKTHGRDRAMG